MGKDFTLNTEHEFSKSVFLGKSHCHLLFTASEKQMAVVCKESPKEYLQPFKDRLEEFFQKGRRCGILKCPPVPHLLRAPPPCTSCLSPGRPRIALAHLPSVGLCSV